MLHSSASAACAHGSRAAQGGGRAQGAGAPRVGPQGVPLPAGRTMHSKALDAPAPRSAKTEHVNPLPVTARVRGDARRAAQLDSHHKKPQDQRSPATIPQPSSMQSQQPVPAPKLRKLKGTMPTPHTSVRDDAPCRAVLGSLRAAAATQHAATCGRRAHTDAHPRHPSRAAPGRDHKIRSDPRASSGSTHTQPTPNAHIRCTPPGGGGPLLLAPGSAATAF